MDAGADDHLDVDVRVSRLATVGTVVANYVAPCGHDADFVEVLRCWAQVFTPRGLDSDGSPGR